MRDKHERKHRRTARHPEAVAMMANADFSKVPPLAEAMGIQRGSNFVAEVNGHHIYRADDGVKCNIWTPGTGWWAFGVSEHQAKVTAEFVSPGPKS